MKGIDTTLMEKLLPHNIEAECGVLGSIIIDQEALVELDFLEPDDFYRDAHNTIFAAIRRLFREGVNADFITLSDELARMNKLDEIGGSSYITSLVNQVPTSSNAEYYGRIVERTSIRRRLIRAAGQIAAIAYEEADARVAFAKAESLIHTISAKRRDIHELQSHRDVIADFMNELDKLYLASQGKGGVTGVSTGMSKLDRISGGFQKGNLIVFAGRPSEGKTALVVTFGVNGIARGYSGILFSVEMSLHEIAQRMLAIKARVNQEHIRFARLNDEEWDRIVAAHDWYTSDEDERGAPRGILTLDGQATITPAQIKNKTLKQMARGPVDFIMVDYIQRIQPDEKMENRALAVGSIARALKSIALELNIPVIVLAQLHRDAANGYPTMEQVKESGDIEQEADLLGLLFQEPDPHTGRHPVRNGHSYKATLAIAKHRNGIVGDIEVCFHPMYTLFEGWEEYLASLEQPPEEYRRPYSE